MTDFLASVAPGEQAYVLDLFDVRRLAFGEAMFLHTPSLTLWCQQCRGPRNFSCLDHDVQITQSCAVFRSYECKNCATQRKMYAVFVEYPGYPPRPDGLVVKIGELPLFAASTADSAARQRAVQVHDLHPEIKKWALPLCENGNLTEGVEKGFKVVRDRLRALTTYERGTDAFGRGKLKVRGAAAPHVAEDFNEGVKYLTMAVDRFRNEKAHVLDGNLTDETRAYEYLRLASLVMHLLEQAYTEEE
jgi:uncharacterized protein (TIGR02391 family)